MSFTFNPIHGLILVQAEITGPAGSAVLQLALDTGATSTLVNAAVLVALGYDPASTPQRVQVTTGSGVEFAPLFPVVEIRALGHTRTDFHILCHTLPPSAAIDGVLGLDFFRSHVLILDFGTGEVRMP